MVPNTCSFDGCDRKGYSRQLCEPHYRQFLKGQPLRKVRGYLNPAPERFVNYVHKTDGCWNWTASRTTDGYGRFYETGGKSIGAHRYAYKLAHGEIPPGMEVDHRCRNILCVNPAHLRLATTKQNGENRGVQKNNKTGVRGVSQTKEGKFRVVVGHYGKHLHFGDYDSLEEAENVAIARRLELFTHNDMDRRGA